MSAMILRTVAEALRDRIAAATSLDGKKIHVGPLDDDDARDADLVLFLYRVSANADLRGAGHTRAPVNPRDPVARFPLALPLDAHFLLTASPSSAGEDLDGLDRLGEVLQALNDVPDLVGGALGGDVVRISLEAATTEEMGRIWSLFPTANYRTSVALLATPLWIDPARSAVAGAPVIDETYRVGHAPAEARHVS